MKYAFPGPRRLVVLVKPTQLTARQNNKMWYSSSM